MVVDQNNEVCPWALQSENERSYHDTEWGIPVTDDDALFEFICLEGAQAGLSWRTILNRRQAYRDAFYQFKIDAIIKAGEADIEALVTQHDIIKNKLKIKSVYTNALAAKKLQQEYGSLEQALWQFVQGKTIINHFTSMADIPVNTKESQAMCQFLKKNGFKFVGETICYALMQATGMVNDHLVSCDCYETCCQKARK